MGIPTRLADNVTRFMFERAAIRGALVSLDDTCREILGQHPYPPALRRVLAEQGMVALTCEFCSHRYSFVAADARALFAPRGGGAGAPPDAARSSCQ